MFSAGLHSLSSHSCLHSLVRSFIPLCYRSYNSAVFLIELREKAAKAKDASVNKISNTRDKYSSTSSKNLDWDANHKRPPPPPPGHTRTASTMIHASTPQSTSPPGQAAASPPPGRAPPIIRRETRPDQTPPYSPSPPPFHVPQAVRSAATPEKIDWANLSSEDKEVLFSWLDEFFERQLNIKIVPRQTQPTVQRTSCPVTPPKPVSF